jgi:hypothetical protein
MTSANVTFWHPARPYQYRMWRDAMLIYCETLTVHDVRWLKGAVGLAEYNHWDVVTVGHPGKWTGATGIVRREANKLGVRVMLCPTLRAARNTASKVAQRK